MTPADIRKMADTHDNLRPNGAPLDEHTAAVLRACADVVDASKALSFYAQTAGGVAGRDENVVHAINVHAAALARLEEIKP